MFFIWWRGQNGVMTGGMEAKDGFGARRPFDAEALGADGNPAIGTDFERRADTPNIRPPRAAWSWAQNGAFFFFGEFPGSLRGHAQFAMGFVGVAVEAQSIDVGVGDFDLGDLFAGEIRRQPSLPELVFPLDFSFGLGCWRIKEANVVKFKRRAQLSQSLGILGKKEGMVIDVNLQWSAVGQERGREEIEVGQQEFAAINFGVCSTICG